MKTTKLFLTILVVFVVATSFATGREKMRVVSYDDCKALVALNAENPSVYKVAIKNDDNQTVYYERTKNPSQMYRGRFDLSELEDGDYVITVKSENEFWVNKLNVENHKLHVGATSKTVAPMLVHKADKLNVSVLNAAQKPVFVNLYKGEEHVYGMKMGRKFNMQKQFDLSELDSGEYKVVISDWHTDYKYTVCK